MARGIRLLIAAMVVLAIPCESVVAQVACERILPAVTSNDIADFGFAVDIVGYDAAIGAPKQDAGTGGTRGGVNIFCVEPDLGWRFNQTIEPTVPTGQGDHVIPGSFGWSVAFEDGGTYLAVGMPRWGCTDADGSAP